MKTGQFRLMGPYSTVFFNTGLSQMDVLTLFECACALYFAITRLTGDIPWISLLWKIDVTLLVPSIYAGDFWDILRQAALTVCVLARLGLASTGAGGGRDGVVSGLNAYNLQTNTYTKPTIYK